MIFEKEVDKNETYIYISDAQENMWKTNFAGRAEKYNDAGDRNFKIAVDPGSDAMQFLDDEGVHVSCWTPKKDGAPDPEREPVYSFKVNVVFGSSRHPLHIYLHADENDHYGEELTEEQVERFLDGMTFSQVDLKVREYNYGGGTSLYLAKADFTQKLDRQDLKYGRGNVNIDVDTSDRPGEVGDVVDEMPFT